MDEGERVVGVAVSTQSWFSNAATLNLDDGLQVADGTTEKTATDLGDQVWGSDDHASDCDQLINVWKFLFLFQ